LRDLGDFDAARGAAQAVLAREPGRFEGWMSLGHDPVTLYRKLVRPMGEFPGPFDLPLLC